MVEVRKYTVRPSKPGKPDHKDSFRVYLSATALHYHDLRAGDLCQLSDAAQSSYPAIVWPASEKIQDTIVQTTKTLQTLYGIKLGDQVSLSRSLYSTRDADEVIMSGYEESEGDSTLPILDQPDKVGWAWRLKHELKKAGILCPGMIFSRVSANDEERTFRIATINGSTDKLLYQSSNLQSVMIAADTERISNHKVKLFSIDASLVGGLNAQISDLNAAIEAYGTVTEDDKLKPGHLPRRGGIVFHGPSGTGKSLLLHTVAQSGWRKIYDVQDLIDRTRVGDAEKVVQDVFSEALRHEPSIIIIDDLDALAGKKDVANILQSLSIVRSLCKGFDKLGGSRVLVIAATRKLALVDESLRRPGRFQTEITIPVPGTDARGEILNIAYSLPKTARDHQLLHLASRTHGYVGWDLVELVQIAMDKALFRIRALNRGKLDGQGPDVGVKDPDVGVKESGLAREINEDDVEAALLKVRPTAMKEIFLDTPNIKWSQVGGQVEVKKALKKAVEWPLKYRSMMERLGATPRKGLLLYGPPGCSKTLVAKALATETKLNFIAVKGAEILSMYVGESERIVREIFQKARVASPSIIFFDEIDAIGASREQSPQGGVQVLTTLLNELDGIEALKGVFVLAATNRPERLDLALVRPGRLDSSIYVGLPDHGTRLEILAITTRTTALAADVDIGILACKTEGYTGAEIVSICQQAGEASGEEELECGHQQRVCMRHFETALTMIPKQVTPQMIERFEAWGRLGGQ